MIDYFATKLKKPNPEPILHALEFLKVPAKRTLSLGDREIDMILLKTGTATGACLWDSDEKEKIIGSRPDYIFDSTMELKNFLKDVNTKT